jgi:hypothetical protein
MGELKPEEEMGQPAEMGVPQDDPSAVIDRVRAAFSDVHIDVHEAEIDRIIAEIRAEARAEVAGNPIP